MLDRMPGEKRIYLSADSIINELGADSDRHPPPIPVEFLRDLNPAGFPPGELTLKIGCPLILLRNIAPSQGLCNGTRMILTQMSDRVLEVKLMGGDHNGETAFIPRIALTPSDNQFEYAFSFRRLQFPVRLALAMSINKAQGQSVKHVGLDLRVPVFTHGQLYVALSRATSHSRIRILLAPDPDTGQPAAHAKTLNIVYPEILLD